MFMQMTVLLCSYLLFFHRPSRVPQADVLGHSSVVSEETVATREPDAHTARLLTRAVCHFPPHRTKRFLLHRTWIHCLRVSKVK